jgi:hypothetical protein
MPERLIKTFISISLVMVLAAGVIVFPQAVNNHPPSFQKPCGMDECNPNMPKCPLCPSFSSINLCPYPEAAAYLPTPVSSFILLSVSSLSDQGVIKTIFHPPISDS